MSTPTPAPAPRRPPVICVVGTTGAGKSDAALLLAERLGGEVINSDALQVYSALDVVTNKVPAADRARVPHHLLDLREVDSADPADRAPYSVRDFARDAARIIDDLHARGKPAVVVGGTHYYLQYLLYGDERGSGSGEAGSDDGNGAAAIPADIAASIAANDAPAMHAHLARLAPAAGAKWHPNDVRRVRRALERHFASGPTPTTSDPVAPLRYPTLAVWVHSDSETLDARLDARVDGMVRRGLFAEVRHLRAVAHRLALSAEDTARGVYVAIGVKELAAYMDAVDAAAKEAGVDPASVPATAEPMDAVDAAIRATVDPAQDPAWPARLADLDRLRDEGLHAVKLATRQYARRQVTWIRRRLGPRLRLAGDPPGGMYVLDTTDATGEAWLAEHVVDPVYERLAAPFIRGNLETWPDPRDFHPRAAELLRLDADPAAVLAGNHDFETSTCAVCQRVLRGAAEVEAHNRSRAHRNAVKKQRKLAAMNAHLDGEPEAKRVKE
ncbi:tRNA dimethylallyltransferase, mitochondrial [Blastocladiella emersonii ATCC 22665]|nr:tRNA dimethylallyltransferase, mitochondrial [Blastocladiella emersonii ATCC 22665]